MNKKFLFTLLVIFLFFSAFCSYSLANNDSMNKTRSSIMNVGNAIGDAAVNTKNAVVDGTKSLMNGAATVGNDVMNGTKNMENDIANDTRAIDDNAVDTMNTTGGIFDNNDGNYTAARTSTNNNFLGMSDSTWTWLILGIVGIAIVALVWYYGAQYEHRNYNND